MTPRRVRSGTYLTADVANLLHAAFAVNGDCGARLNLPISRFEARRGYSRLRIFEQVVIPGGVMLLTVVGGDDGQKVSIGDPNDRDAIGATRSRACGRKHHDR